MSEPTAHQRITRAGHSAQFADIVLEQRDREVAEEQRRTHDEDRRPHGTAMTPADELRAAAQTLRDLAHAATPGPWRQHDTHLGQYGYTATVLSGEGNDTDLRAWLPSMSQTPWDETRNAWPDAAYIAAMHPGVGAALADWLETAAKYADKWPADHMANSPFRQGGLAVARAINGSEQP